MVETSAHDWQVVAEHGVLRRRCDTLVGQHAGEDDRLGLEIAQQHVERRIEEGAEPHLLDIPVVGMCSERLVDFVAPGVLAQAAVLEERPVPHEGAAVDQAARAVPCPDHRNAATARFGGQLGDRFDRPAHVRYVDARLGVVALGTEKIILRIDMDERGAAGHEFAVDRFERDRSGDFGR
jgi:hypothetical protein